MKKLLFLLFFLNVTSFSFAQNAPRSEDILFKTEIVRLLDLDWSSSRKIFGTERTIPVILWDAVLRGDLQAYSDTKCLKPIAVGELLEKMNVYEGDSSWQSYGAESLHELEIGEDLIFDAKRSEHYFLPKYLVINIPESLNTRGLKEPFAVFRFADCEKIFKSDDRAWSEERLILGRKVNYADLFVMKCFYSETLKIGHAHSKYFDQQYSDKTEAFVHAKDAENTLVNMLYRMYNPK